MVRLFVLPQIANSHHGSKQVILLVLCQIHILLAVQHALVPQTEIAHYLQSLHSLLFVGGHHSKQRHQAFATFIPRYVLAVGWDIRIGPCNECSVITYDPRRDKWHSTMKREMDGEGFTIFIPESADQIVRRSMHSEEDCQTVCKVRFLCQYPFKIGVDSMGMTIDGDDGRMQ